MGRDGNRMQVQIVCSRHRVGIRTPISAEYPLPPWEIQNKFIS